VKELSQTEYATARGVSPAYVTKLKRQGRLVLTPGGKVNVEATDRLIESTRDPARGGDRRPGAGEEDGAATDARTAAAPGAQRPGGGGFQTYKEAARRERIAKARIA
jgi:phage terminase Nu1 subunit (DNA packaging protein)